MRIASILRRAPPRAIAGPPASVRFGDFSFDLGRGELRQRDDIIRLTDREREMLRLLAENAGETVARETLAGSGGPPMSGRLMCRSTGCAARSSAIPPIRCICKPRGARATACWSTAETSERGRALSLSLPVSFEQPRSWWRAFWRKLRHAPAQGPLCAGASHCHRADGDPAMRAHLCVHGAALAAHHHAAFHSLDA